MHGTTTTVTAIGLRFRGHAKRRNQRALVTKLIASATAKEACGRAVRAGPLALGGGWLACTENFADLSWVGPDPRRRSRPDKTHCREEDDARYDQVRVARL